MHVQRSITEARQMPRFEAIDFPRFNSRPSFCVGDAGRTAFIVDDNQEILGLISSILSKVGWATKEFSDGDAFARAIIDAPPELCLIDLSMPKPDGIEVLRDLVAAGYKGDIVFISGHGSQIRIKRTTPWRLSNEFNSHYIRYTALKIT